MYAGIYMCEQTCLRGTDTEYPVKIRDNFSKVAVKTCSVPSLEPSWQDGSNVGSQQV